VGVGEDGNGVDVHGNGEVIADFVSALAGRNIDAIGAERYVEFAAGGLLAGEIKCDTSAVDGGFAGGMVVDLEDEVGARVEKLGDVGGELDGLSAGGPAAEAARGQESWRAETASRLRAVPERS
jgi:hypothetical protein